MISAEASTFNLDFDLHLNFQLSNFDSHFHAESTHTLDRHARQPAKPSQLASQPAYEPTPNTRTHRPEDEDERPQRSNRRKMPKFFCDYCDVYLTHDSMSVRKAHNNGRNHMRNVIDYYQQIGHEKAQAVIDGITNSYAAEGQAMPSVGAPGNGPPGFPPGGMPGFPPAPGQAMPPGKTSTKASLWRTILTLF